MDKNYLIKCVRCSWSRAVGDDPNDVKDLYEYTSCATCKQLKKFRCLKCGRIAKQFPIKN